MLCYRCGGHVKDGEGRCGSCGQRFDPGLKAGPAAGFGAGIKRPRHAIEGAPCQPGDIVAGRYQVREHVGAGPLGWMFRAIETSTDGSVALKILSPRFLQMPEEKATFQSELAKAAKLSHPNIARVYEAGEDGGKPFIVAQHLEGMTLRRIMDLRRQKAQRFTLAEVEPIVAQMAAALDAAKSAHGNLKPDNVIVLPDLLKLTDFGLAVSLPRAPFMAAQRAAGVHRYLAPEFLLGEPLDARTDVFSLGVMLGEMLSSAQFDAQLSLIEKNPGLPESVDELFRKAVSPRPNARFASAGELAAELSELVDRPLASERQSSDVVILEAVTDPRVRIARALDATRAADETPAPPVAAAAAPPITQPDPPRPAPLEPAAVAALSKLPLPVEPFTPPPPYEPPPVFAAAIEEPRVAPVVSEELRQVAASIGATEELLTAETAVRAAPSSPLRPRRGAGKRKDKKRRKSSPPGLEPAWSSAPPTEAAVAIGPVTSALEPMRPEKPRVSSVSFAALEEKPASSRAPLYAVGVVAVIVLAGGVYSVVSSRKPVAEPDEVAASAERVKTEPVKAEPVKAERVKTEPVKAEPLKAEPVKVAEQKPDPAAVIPVRRDGGQASRIRSLKQRVERALADHKRRREEALAAARLKAAPVAEKAVAQTAPIAQPIAATTSPAEKQLAKPNQPPPPAGAITGLGDGDLLVSKKAAPASFVSAAADVARCPPGMVKVPGGAAAVGSDASDDLRNFGDRSAGKVELKTYCIDQYEFPNQPGKLPRVAAAWTEAESECRNAGKRLCSEDEWEAACRGPQNLRFPYGTRYDPDACNTSDAKDNPRQTTVAGAFSRCKSGYNVWDLSGNVAEWTASPFDDGKTVKGGHAGRPGFDDRCASRRKLGLSAKSISVGFRCCADAR